MRALISGYCNMAIQWTQPAVFQNFVHDVNILEAGAEQVGSETYLGLGIERLKMSERV